MPQTACHSVSSSAASFVTIPRLVITRTMHTTPCLRRDVHQIELVLTRGAVVAYDSAVLDELWHAVCGIHFSRQVVLAQVAMQHMLDDPVVVACLHACMHMTKACLLQGITTTPLHLRQSFPAPLRSAGHESWVLSVACHPSGTAFATGSSDSKIKLWDLQTRTCSQTVSEHTDQASAKLCLLTNQ